jgi:hypothetical protein
MVALQHIRRNWEAEHHFEFADDQTEDQVKKRKFITV